MTKNNPGRRFPLSGSGEALFWLSFFPDEIGAGPGLKFDLFLLKHVLMPWTVVAIAMGVGLTGRGLPPHLAQRTAHSSPHPARPPASSPAPWGGGSHGDTQGKAVPRIAINREHPDEISTKFGISCFVGHYCIISSNIVHAIPSHAKGAKPRSSVAGRQSPLRVLRVFARGGDRSPRIRTRNIR
ncbi:hypothetical protein BN140_2495 [Methanoculleus bourgensis MS2]|uniref:Uncharacterized protein n=1 Tax=Methanoculleus bourgensis (strain ATCC 43281 / DSM 3045 / OCM 15 / MS2) TaxID=1201294 RepID=I7JAX1_METBM|nr:hypothetical protein BN140_2495 [Methanoculleus bourgensis MS2]